MNTLSSEGLLGGLLDIFYALGNMADGASTLIGLL